MKHKASILFLLAGITIWLAGCASPPLAHDTVFKGYAPGEGLIGLDFNSLDDLQMASFESAKGGKGVYIRDIPAGRSIYLYSVKAGTYCLSQFHFGKWTIHSNGGSCFTVTAGKFNYAGEFLPRAIGKQVYMLQEFNLKIFNGLLHSQYPRIAAQVKFDGPVPEAYDNGQS